MAGSALREAVFWRLEVPALSAAVLGLAGLGWVWRTSLTGRVLLVTPLLALAATLALRYMPHGPLMGIALALALTAKKELLTSAEEP